ncbi:HAD family hydrolase [Endozoicomonas arenosclerae]|uniref:HAD family hydrolase n=1 Tax=Endozoicomonas arenosclerae TaxID=1633495 RepID=UPI000785A8C0|nr:HAD family hydrolase [Endozoicomonas arenosclerae]
MIKIYLFDWGDTLMIDFPGVPGKMCDWEVVQTVDGAEEVLEELSSEALVYVATGAAESTEAEIKSAFDRVNLSQYISGYFCKANLGVTKGSPEFLKSILAQLNVTPQSVAMVGDSIEKDIKPALSIGIQAILFSPHDVDAIPDNVKVIHNLRELSLKQPSLLMPTQ